MQRLQASILILALLVPAPLSAAAGRWRKIWKASLIALTTSSAVDAASSWGGLEANPMLAGRSGRFGRRAVAIKVSIAGAVALSQALIVLRHPAAAPYAASVNLGASGLFTWAAIHNTRVRMGPARGGK